MDELIKRSEALEKLKIFKPYALDATEWQLGQFDQWETDYAAIERLTPVDAVPVVRCHDCIHSDPDWSGYAPCSCRCKLYPRQIVLHKPDHFCSYGEHRKDGNDD